MGGITRRKFVKMGAQGIALATIPAIFKMNPVKSIESFGIKDLYLNQETIKSNYFVKA